MKINSAISSDFSKLLGDLGGVAEGLVGKGVKAGENLADGLVGSVGSWAEKTVDSFITSGGSKLDGLAHDLLGNGALGGIADDLVKAGEGLAEGLVGKGVKTGESWADGLISSLGNSVEKGIDGLISGIFGGGSPTNAANGNPGIVGPTKQPSAPQASSSPLLSTNDLIAQAYALVDGATPFGTAGSTAAAPAASESVAVPSQPTRNPGNTGVNGAPKSDPTSTSKKPGGILGDLDGLIEDGVGALEKLADNLITSLGGKLEKAADGLVKKIGDFLEGKADDLVKTALKGLESIPFLGSLIKPFEGTLEKAADGLVSKIAGGLESTVDGLIHDGVSAAEKAAEGLVGNIGNGIEGWAEGEVSKLGGLFGGLFGLSA